MCPTAPAGHYRLACYVLVAGLALGGTFGVLAGFVRRYKIDNVIMRIMDIFQAIPAILMAIAVVAVSRKRDHPVGSGYVYSIYA